MQTFLPYADYTHTAKVLDDQRLGKQRVECKQILLALRKWKLLAQGMKPATTAWMNHPAVLMWKGFERELCAYGMAMCWEFKARGNRDELEDWFFEESDEWPACDKPSWLGDERLHASHRSNLLRKNPFLYQQHQWKEPNDLPYHWPVLGLGAP